MRWYDHDGQNDDYDHDSKVKLHAIFIFVGLIYDFTFFHNE